MTAYRVFLRHPPTGFARVWESDEMRDPEFMFSDGNYSCDCNRSYFLTDWGKEGPQELRDMANNETGLCLGGPTIVVDKIEEVATGRIVYTEDGP